MNSYRITYTVMNGDVTLKQGLTKPQVKQFLKQNEKKYLRLHVVNEKFADVLSLSRT
jgi:hypothetical protein